MSKGTSGKTFAALVEDICRREGSIAQAARTAGVDRGWLSKVAKGTEKPPSLNRLEEMSRRWKLGAAEAEALRRSAMWEKANPAAKTLLRESGYLEEHPVAAAPARHATVIMGEKDARRRLYREFVPVIGYYCDDGIIPPADYTREGEGSFLVFGPVPKGSVAVKLLEGAAGFAQGAFMVFGPAARPRIGLGLLSIRGAADRIGVCQRTGREVEVIIDGEIAAFSAGKVLSFRPFIAPA